MLSTQKFALVRILGNDLPPCHGPTQTIDNVRFILESEPDLPNCSKHWIINRMCNPMHEAHLVGLLESYGQSIEKLSFDLTEYANLPLMEETPYSTPWFRPARRKRLRLHAKKARLNYVTNNNNARNYAIEFGASFADWILPLDGNCMLDPAAWNEIQQSAEAPSLKYLVIPMIRRRSNNDISSACAPAHGNFTEEPQLGFHRTSSARFDPCFYYGRRDKVEMLWRLGVLGPWDSYRDEPWDLPRPRLAADHQDKAVAGWVSRLESGSLGSRLMAVPNANERNRLRSIACLSLLKRLDAQAAQIPVAPPR